MCSHLSQLELHCRKHLSRQLSVPHVEERFAIVKGLQLPFVLCDVLVWAWFQTFACKSVTVPVGSAGILRAERPIAGTSVECVVEP